MGEIILEDGKYRFYVHLDDSTLLCDRHGETWRDFIGDKAVSALFTRCLDLQMELAKERGRKE